MLEKYAELWNKIKSVIKKINDKSGKYEKDYMKIKKSNSIQMIICH